MKIKCNTKLTVVGFIVLTILIITFTVLWISYQVSSLPTGNYFPETEKELTQEDIDYFYPRP